MDEKKNCRFFRHQRQRWRSVIASNSIPKKKKNSRHLFREPRRIRRCREKSLKTINEKKKNDMCLLEKECRFVIGRNPRNIGTRSENEKSIVRKRTRKKAPNERDAIRISAVFFCFAIERNESDGSLDDANMHFFL